MQRKMASLGPDDSGLEQLALTVRTMLDADQTTPIVVPTLALRSRLRDALAPEFPDLQVFAEQEFPPCVRLLASPPHVDARPETGDRRHNGPHQTGHGNFIHPDHHDTDKLNHLRARP